MDGNVTSPQALLVSCDAFSGPAFKPLILAGTEDLHSLATRVLDGK